VTEIAIALNTTANIVGFAQGQAKGLTDGAFAVVGFSGAGFHEEVPLNHLVAPVPIRRDQLTMVRGTQAKQHVYWLRYLRRGFGATDKKRVCVELLVRFTTFDYVPKATDNPTPQELAALTGYPLWGISDVSITMMATGRGRNPFNKFNEVGSLAFDIAASNDGLPHFRVEYRVQHQGKNLLGVPMALSHNDVGAFLIHSNGSFEIAPGEQRTPKHFRITPISGQIHQRVSRVTAAPPPANPPTITLLNAQQVALGPVAQAPRAQYAPRVKNLQVRGFDRVNTPDHVDVTAAAPPALRAFAADADGREGAFRLEYIRNGSAAGTQVRTKIRVLLLLRFTLVSYLTAADANGNQQIVYQHGLRYTGFRHVSLSVLDVGLGDPLVVGADGHKYDVAAIKNRFKEDSAITFAPQYEEVQGVSGVQVRIDWSATHAGSSKSRAHQNNGRMRLAVDQSGTPVLRLLDQDSNKYFTVTG
jgi:hypothetical protein